MIRPYRPNPLTTSGRQFIRLRKHLLSYRNRARDAILRVTDNSIGAGYDPLSFIISAFESQAETIKELRKSLDYNVDALSKADKRVQELSEGACRFNCRTRKDAFKSGYQNGFEDATLRYPCRSEESYGKWRNECQNKEMI